MDEIVKIVVDDFEKRPDGSWVSVKNSDIVTRNGKVIRLQPGFTFRKGMRLWGFDVAEVLDEFSESLQRLRGL